MSLSNANSNANSPREERRDDADQQPLVDRDADQQLPDGEQPAGMLLRGGRVVRPRPSSHTGQSSQQVPFSSHVVNDPGHTESLISLETLTEALRASRGRSEPDLTKGKLPDWNYKTESFVAYEQKVFLWLGQFELDHLLQHAPSADEQRVHARARTQVLMSLPDADRTTVYRMSHLCEAWSYLTAKYRPSTEAEIHRLWSRFNSLSQHNKDVATYCGEVMSVYTQLEALGADVGQRWLRLKLLEVGEEFNAVRGSFFPTCNYISFD